MNRFLTLALAAVALTMASCANCCKSKKDCSSCDATKAKAECATCDTKKK